MSLFSDQEEQARVTIASYAPRGCLNEIACGLLLSSILVNTLLGDTNSSQQGTDVQIFALEPRGLDAYIVIR